MNTDCVLRTDIEAPHTQTAVPAKTDSIAVDNITIRAVIDANTAVGAILIRKKCFTNKNGSKPFRSTEKRHDV